MTTLTLAQAQRRLRSLQVELSRQPDHSVTITEDGKEVMVVLSSERYQSLQETAEVRGDAPLMQSLFKSVEEIQAGKAIGWETAKQHLGW